MKATRMGRIRNIHFVGIGGAGMAGIAEVLVYLGYSVSGPDVEFTGGPAGLTTAAATCSALNLLVPARSPVKARPKNSPPTVHPPG